MPFGREVGLGSGHIVLDGDAAPHSPIGHSPPFFGPCLLWPKGRPSQLLLSTCLRIWNPTDFQRHYVGFRFMTFLLESLFHYSSHSASKKISHAEVNK